MARQAATHPPASDPAQTQEAHARDAPQAELLVVADLDVLPASLGLGSVRSLKGLREVY
jgi:hypothetical protein